jgi:hypothetical protein
MRVMPFAFRVMASAFGSQRKSIVAERECCPFSTFGVTALPDRGLVIVCATGRAAKKELLRTVL